MKQEVKIGQTDYTVLILVRDSTTGAPKTALTFESEGIDVCYTRVETDNDVVLTDGAPVTTTLTGDHVDWGFVLVDDTKAPGLYKLDIADGVFASGAWSAVVSFICTGCDPVHIEFVLVPEAPTDGVKINSIADDKITAASINTAALTADAFAADAIVASTLATGALTADAFAADAIVAATLATGAITADAFAADAIVAATLNTGCITADAFAANAIVAATLASDCIEAAKIKDGAITNAKVADDVDVNVKTITANAITATAINADAITADKIADNAIAAEHLAANAIDLATFAADCKTGSALKANVETITAGIIANASFNADVGSTAYATNIIALAVRKVLDELNLDHLLKVDTTVAADGDLTTYVADGSVMSHIMTAGADTSDYAASTDSLEKTGDNQAAVIAAVVTNAAGADVSADVIALKVVADLIEDILRNKMEITDADGEVVLYADDSATPLYTVAGGVTDDSTTTTRLRLA